MKITAHSGCDNTKMNSMEFLEHASALDIDAVEIDVRKDPEGILVLGHDVQVGENPVTLEEAFRFINKTGLLVNCDLKEQGIEEKVVETAKKTGMSVEKLIFSGCVRPCQREERLRRIGDVEIYMNIEELVPRINESLENGSYPSEEDLIKALQLCSETGCRVINTNFHVCTEGFKKMCEKFQLKISAWTVTDKEDIEQIIRLGVHNITSRAPGLVKEVLEKSDFMKGEKHV
jgi:glycerophosphoryl diester phosphodiesterase